MSKLFQWVTFVIRLAVLQTKMVPYVARNKLGELSPFSEEEPTTPPT